MKKRKTVDDQLPGEEGQRNDFIPDDVYAYYLIRIVLFCFFLLGFVNKL